MILDIAWIFLFTLFAYTSAKDAYWCAVKQYIGPYFVNFGCFVIFVVLIIHYIMELGK